MAGNRLYSEFSNDNGDVYRVSIYDTNAAWNPASASTFKLGGDGFVLKYSGNNEQQHQPSYPVRWSSRCMKRRQRIRRRST